MPCVIPFPAPAPAPDDVVALHDAVAGIRRRHRRLVAAAGRWALARGLSLPADHVALWAAAAENAMDVGDWCTAARCRPPADLAESWRHLGGFLAGNFGLASLGPTPAPSPGPKAA